MPFPPLRRNFCLPRTDCPVALGFLSVLLLSSFGTTIASAGESTGGTKRLSLHDAVKLAFENNLKLEIESIDVDIQDTSIDEAYGAFEPELNLRAVYESIENPQNQREFIATSSGGDAGGQSRLFEEENILLESSIDGKFTSGTEWSLVAESDRLRNSLNIQRSSLFYPEYDSFVGLRMTQPLLRDFGSKVQLTNVRLAVSDKQLADIDWQRQVRETVAEIAKSYYDLLYAQRDQEIKRDSIALAKKLLAGNRERLEEGVAISIEVRQAEVAVSVREEALISSTHFYTENQNLLIRQLFRDFDIANPPRLLPTGSLRSTAPAIDKVALLSAAISNRPEYQANLEQLKKSDIQIQYYENQLLPRIDLVGTLGGNGLAEDYGSSLGDTASEDGVQWSVGFVVSIPLGTRTEKARIKARQLEKRQMVLNLKQIELDIGVQIDTAASRVETTRQRLETASRSAELARVTLAEEEERLIEGVTNSFQILAAQDDVAASETRRLAAQADLNKALIDLWLASGTLLDKLNVSMESASQSKPNATRTPIPVDR